MISLSSKYKVEVQIRLVSLCCSDHSVLVRPSRQHQANICRWKQLLVVLIDWLMDGPIRTHRLSPSLHNGPAGLGLILTSCSNALLNRTRCPGGAGGV